MDRREALREELLGAGVLQATSVDGLYQRSATFERIVRGVEALATSADDGVAEPPVYAAPVMARDTFVKTDYLRSFPDLIGSVEIFAGGDREHVRLLQLADEGADWTQALQPSEVMLCSAACHSLYGDLTGTLPAGGRTLQIQGTCFRHEPSRDPMRMQSFRMHEFVHVGAPEDAQAHRDSWLAKGLELLGSLGLPVSSVVANDPFFGRAGKMLATNQRETALKFEIVCPVTSEESPTAISSANYHLDHFGLPFDIVTSDGAVAHSACFGFGLDRITLALLATHGMDVSGWPATVRERLWP